MDDLVRIDERACREFEVAEAERSKRRFDPPGIFRRVADQNAEIARISGNAVLGERQRADDEVFNPA